MDSPHKWSVMCQTVYVITSPYHGVHCIIMPGVRLSPSGCVMSDFQTPTESLHEDTNVPVSKFTLIVIQTTDVYNCHRYTDVIMSMMTSRITSLAIVYSTLYSGADQRKHQSSASQMMLCLIGTCQAFSVESMMMKCTSYTSRVLILSYMSYPFRHGDKINIY